MAENQISEIELSGTFYTAQSPGKFLGKGAQNQIGQLSRSARTISVDLLSKQILLSFAIFNIYSVQFI